MDFSCKFDIQVFGFNAGAHHDMNVLFHIIGALLLFWMLRRATGYTGRSFIVAALFATDPLTSNPGSRSQAIRN